MDAEWGPNSDPAECLTELVSRYQTALRRMCYFFLHDAAMAEDAVQETFLKAYKALPKWRGECSAKSWLMRIALNACRDMTRTAWFRHTDKCVTPEDLPLQAENPVDVEAMALHEAIRKLPRRLQEAVLLYYYQDMSLQEVAEVLGAAPSAISKRLKKARETLREDLERGDRDA